MKIFKANIAILEDDETLLYNNVSDLDVDISSNLLSEHSINVTPNEKLVSTIVYKPLDQNFINFFCSRDKNKDYFDATKPIQEGYNKRYYQTVGALAYDPSFLYTLGWIKSEQNWTYETVFDHLREKNLLNKFNDLLYVRLPFQLPVRYFKDKNIGDIIFIPFNILDQQVMFELTIARPLIILSEISHIEELIERLASTKR